MTYKLTSTSHFLTFNTTHAEHVAYVLGLLSEFRASATFFLSAEVVREQAHIARAIARAGHEVASYCEAPADDWNSFRENVRDTKALVEHASASHVRGFRAAPGSIGSHTPWAFEILVEEGYDYDSSCVPDRVQPTRRTVVPDYAYSVLCGSGSLVELPITTIDSRGRTLQARTRDGLPAVAAFACQELAAEEPRARLPIVALARQYGLYNGKRAPRDRVARLLRDFRFEAIGHRLGELGFGSPTTYAA